jgi:hypothetical protein
MVGWGLLTVAPTTLGLPGPVGSALGLAAQLGPDSASWS